MKKSVELKKKGTAQVTIAAIGNTIAPFPAWIALAKKGAENITLAKCLDATGMVEVLVEVGKKNPELINEYTEELKVLSEMLDKAKNEKGEENKNESSEE